MQRSRPLHHRPRVLAEGDAFYCSHPACGRFEKGTEAAGV